MKNLIKKEADNKGFTLIELLIVVAIIAILAAIAVPNFLEAQIRAKVSRAQADMRTIAICVESYIVDNNKYPPFGIPAGYSNTCGGATVGGITLIGDSAVGVRQPNGDIACGVSSRLAWITTPIAYCSSVLPEAFNVKNATLQGLPGEDPLNYDTYDFFVAANVTPGGSLGGTRGASTTSGAAWRLASAGPDNIAAFGGLKVSDGPTAQANQLGADYDSTNGTVSAGDIIRVGGGQGPLFTELPYYYRVGNNLTSINNMPPIN